MKALNILSAVCAVVGVPWAALLWLAGAMKSAPGLDTHELAMCLPLPVAAVLSGTTSILLSRFSTPRRATSKWAIAAAVASLVTAAVVVGTYFDMKEPRFLK